MARTCARAAMRAGSRMVSDFGAALEQPHVVQHVIERDELLRRVACRCAPACAAPLTQPTTRWSNSGCVPIA